MAKLCPQSDHLRSLWWSPQVVNWALTPKVISTNTLIHIQAWVFSVVTVNTLYVRCTSKMPRERCTESLLCCIRCREYMTMSWCPPEYLGDNIQIKLRTQRPKGELYRKSPKYRGMLAWNKLEGNVQRLEPYGKFVSELKKWEYLNHYSNIRSL